MTEVSQMSSWPPNPLKMILEPDDYNTALVQQQYTSLIPQSNSTKKANSYIIIMPATRSPIGLIQTSNLLQSHENTKLKTVDPKVDLAEFKNFYSEGNTLGKSSLLMCLWISDKVLVKKCH